MSIESDKAVLEAILNMEFKIVYGYPQSKKVVKKKQDRPTPDEEDKNFRWYQVNKWRSKIHLAQERKMLRW